jgi:predicted phage tail component-like protein
MIFGGVDLGDYLIAAGAVDSLLPPIEAVVQEVPGMDGARYIGRKIGPRTIKMKVLMRPTADRAGNIRELAAVLLSDEPKRLVLDGDPERSYMAVLSDDSALDSLWRHGGCELTFTCPDPVAYGRRRRATFGSEGRFRVGGTYPARGVLEVVPASGSAWQVTNVNTGRFVRVEAAFNGSRRLRIDMRAQRCTIDGAAADGYVTLASDYFDLPPGEAHLSTTNGSSTMTWEDRWL